MPTPIDLRVFASALPEQNLSPRSLNASVCKNITTAVAALSKQSPAAKYTIDHVLLTRIVGEYLQTHPKNNNPFNLLVTRDQGACRVFYYDLFYKVDEHFQGRSEFFAKQGLYSLAEGKVTTNTGEVQEGKRQYIGQLKKVCLVDGKVTGRFGRVQEGKWQYVETLKGMQLVDGKRTAQNGDSYSGTFKFVLGVTTETQMVNGTLSYSTGRSETGDFAYIPQLNCMKLVNGTIKNAEGDVVEEGTRSYVPELNEVVLTAGSITQGSTAQKGTWAYSQDEGQMVFTPKKVKPKLPQNTRNQIQSAVQELVRIQQRFDSTGKYNTSAAMLNTAAEQAKLAQTPEQFDTTLQSFSAQYKTLTRELSRLTHPDKVANYSANTHGAALQKLVDLRETIDGQVRRWMRCDVNWN